MKKVSFIQKVRNFTRYRYTRWRDRKYLNDIFLIYTMGKVGSSTIFRSLRSRLPLCDVFHLHFLSKKWLEEILPRLEPEFHINISKGNEVNELINKKDFKRKNIITLVRDPLARDLSSIFENIEVHFKDKAQISVGKVKELMLKSDFKFAQKWIETEFNDTIGFDLFKQVFDARKGYEIYGNGNLNILVLKLETLNENYEEALDKFLGLRGVELKNSNISTKKYYQEL